MAGCWPERYVPFNFQARHNVYALTCQFLQVFENLFFSIFQQKFLEFNQRINVYMLIYYNWNHLVSFVKI